MFRPKDWANPYDPKLWQMDFVTGFVYQETPITDDGIVKMHHTKSMPAHTLMDRGVGYEAGADAMLEALWKMAQESPTGTFTLDTNTVRNADIIQDGLGSVWSAYCPVCKEKSMSVVRPGKVQCDNCG